MDAIIIIATKENGFSGSDDDVDVLVTIYYVGGGDRERQSLGVGLGRPLQSNVFTAQDGQNYLKNTLKVPY